MHSQVAVKPVSICFELHFVSTHQRRFCAFLFRVHDAVGRFSYLLPSYKQSLCFEGKATLVYERVGEKDVSTSLAAQK